MFTIQCAGSCVSHTQDHTAQAQSVASIVQVPTVAQPTALTSGYGDDMDYHQARHTAARDKVELWRIQPAARVALT